MQSALIIGPIAVSVAELGFAHCGHPGQAFADSFSEGLDHLAPDDREVDGLPAAGGTPVWNDGLLSTVMRGWAAAGPDAGIGNPKPAPTGLDIGSSADGAGREAAIGRLLLRAAPGATARDDGAVPPDEIAAAIPSLDGRGQAFLPSETPAAQPPSPRKAEDASPGRAPADSAKGGDKTADGGRSGAMTGDGRPGWAAQVTTSVAPKGTGSEAIDEMQPITTGRSEEDSAAVPPTSGLAAVEIARHPSEAVASIPPPGCLAESGSGHGAAPGSDQSRPVGTLLHFPPETAIGLSVDTNSGPDEPGPSSRIPGSFWERVFLDATGAQATGGLRSAAVGSTGLGSMAGTPPANGGAIPMPVAASTVHSAEKDQSVAPAPEDGMQTPDPIASTDPATSPATVAPSDRVSRHLVAAWSDTVSHPAVEADPLQAFGLSAPSAGPASQAAQPGPTLSLPVPQVAAQIAAVLRRTADGAAELSLAPTELGRVRLRIETDARDPDRLRILIDVERPETLQLFRRHAAELADALRSAGYSGSSIDFGQQDQGHQREAGRDDRPSLALPEPGDTEGSPLPFRNVIGETLDLRL